jgi:hypothetical protein
MRYLLFLFAWALHAQPWPNLVGAGLSDGLEGGRGRMFVDVAKGHRPMVNPATGKAAPVDENGWPTTDASTVFFDIRPVPAWAPPIDDPDQFQPDWSGVYKLSFRGQAELGGYDRSSIRVENQAYDPETNMTRADVRVDPGAGLLTMLFSNTRRTAESEAGTGITDVRLIRPDYDEDTEKVFTDEFLALLQPYSVLRYMGFLMTNSTNPFYGDEKNVIEWADRRLPTDATQQRTAQRAAGVAWEYAVDIANAAGRDMWINIPIAASDDYIAQLAALLRDRLKPELNIYIEISNEVWNYSFTQYTYNKMAAVDEVTNKGEPYLNNPAVETSDRQEVWARRRVLRRLHDAMAIFARVFGTDQVNSRLRAVYAWWTIYPAQYAGILEWSRMHFGDPKWWLYAIAKTNYYDDRSARLSQSPEEVVAAMKVSSDRGRSYTRQLKSVADQYELKLVTYEAGPDNGGGATANIGNRIRANRLPEMGALLKYDFTGNWLSEGGDLYMFLEVVGAYSRYGCWGQTEDALDRKTWKLRAIYDLVGLPPPD